MEEATFFDLLGTGHYYLIAFGLLTYFPALFLFWKWKKTHKKKLLLIGLIVFLGTAVFSLLLRAIFFPGGGGFYHPRYRSDRFEIIFTQEALESFKQDCGRYPTNNEGLNALNIKPPSLECLNYNQYLTFVSPYMDYTSAGITYKIVGTRSYGTLNLIIKGTNEFKAKLLIKKKIAK